MPRRPLYAECKICGGNATIKRHHATGANGRVYLYEVYIHRNGTSHYFRTGDNSSKKEPINAFQEMIEKRMNDGKYRFKEIKELLESIRGTEVSNTNVHRNLEKAMRLNLVERKTENGVILYSRRVKDDAYKRQRINQAIVTLNVYDSEMTMTTLLRFDNQGQGPMKGIPFAIPVGSLNNLFEIDLDVFDHLGKIPKDAIQIAYSFAGQTGILINFNRPIKPSESGFLFIISSLRTGLGQLKMALPLDIDSFRIHITELKDEKVSIRKRFLDGIKEAYPDYITRGHLVDDRTFIEAEFESASKGDTIVVSMGHSSS
jgi:hypothetical protein